MQLAAVLLFGQGRRFCLGRLFGAEHFFELFSVNKDPGLAGTGRGHRGVLELFDNARIIAGAAGFHGSAQFDGHRIAFHRR